MFSASSRPSHQLGHGAAHARRYKLALLVGFTLFTVGVVSAHLSPADGYEVSIYWATPALYWFGVGSALVVSLATLLYGHDTRFAPFAVLLGGLSIASMLALPLIRNYYFFGFADPLTHLGRIRAMWGGWRTFFDSIYPGSYVATIFVGLLGGIATPRAMQYVMFVFALVFVVFVPLAVYLLVLDRRALFLGLFSGFLLLPINDVSIKYLFHPFSMTTMYSALVIYLFVGHVTRAFDDDTLPRLVNAATFVFPLATAALLFFHPQTTADVLVIFGVVAVVQLWYRHASPDHPLASYRAIYGQFAFLAVLFVVWAGMHDGAGRTVNLLIESVSQWFVGEAQTAEIVQQRTRQAESIGFSIYEMFVKLFLVSAIYCLLAGGLAVAKFVRLRRGSDVESEAAKETSSTILYFAYGGLGLIPFVFVHSLGKADDYLFRHIGFAMVVVTVIGAVGLYFVLGFLRDALGTDALEALKPVLGAVAVLALALSLLTVYVSPFVYLPGQHVSSYQMHGYETAFEMQPDDRSVPFGGVRQASERYEEAMFAAPNEPWTGSPDVRSSGPVAGGNITHLRRHYETHLDPATRRDHYFVLAEEDFESELVAYNGIRHSRENLSSVARQRGVYDVYSNGGYRLYYVDTSGTPAINTSPAPNSTQVGHSSSAS